MTERKNKYLNCLYREWRGESDDENDYHNDEKLDRTFTIFSVLLHWFVYELIVLSLQMLYESLRVTTWLNFESALKTSNFRSLGRCRLSITWFYFTIIHDDVIETISLFIAGSRLLPTRAHLFIEIFLRMSVHAEIWN